MLSTEELMGIPVMYNQSICLGRRVQESEKWSNANEDSEIAVLWL